MPKAVPVTMPDGTVVKDWVVTPEFIMRSSLSHTREFRLRSYRWQPGNTGTSTPMGLTLPGGKVVYNIPIEDGDLTLDSTNPHLRRLRVQVPGEEWIPTDNDHPLAPFGQFLVLWVRIDMPDQATGGVDRAWSPWLKLGEFPIVSQEVSRPSGLCTVEAVDWSHRVNEYGFVHPHSWKGRSRREAIKQVVDEALPSFVYDVKASINADKVLTEEQGQISQGTGRWDFAKKVADLAGLDVFFDRNGDLVIRNAIVGFDGYVTGAGPDIGSTSNPVATLVEGPGGCIKGITPSVTRENAANGVHITVKPSSPGKSATKSEAKTRVVSAITRNGPATYGDVFGRITLHRDMELGKSTTNKMRDAQVLAAALLSRRQGVIRRLTIEAIPLWWLEPDDKVNVTWRQRMPDNTERIRTETHYVESLVLPLRPEGSMKLTTRQVAVVELEEPWTPEPEPNPDYTPGDPYVPPEEPVAPAPTPVLPPDYALLQSYKDALTANPSTYPQGFVNYGIVTHISDADTFDVDVYTSSSFTTRGTITHPNGTKYGNIRIRVTGMQAPEPSWAHGPAAEAFFRSFVSVGDKMMLRADSNEDATHGGTVRIWREAYKLLPDGKTWKNVALRMIDLDGEGGWAFAFPLKFAPRNRENRIAHMKIAMWYGRGMFANPSPHHPNLRINVFGNPSGDDTGANEYATITNTGPDRIDLSGWLFGDPSPIAASSGGGTFTFPAGSFVNAGQTIAVRVGKGSSNPSTGVYYMGRSSALWNNDGDIAILHDAGKLVAAVAHFDGVKTFTVPIKPVIGAHQLRGGPADEVNFPGVGG